MSRWRRSWRASRARPWTPSMAPNRPSPYAPRSMYENHAARIRAAKQGVERADEPPIGGEIGRDHAFPMLRRDMGEGREATENGGVADEDVEPAEALIKGRAERVDAFAVG